MDGETIEPGDNVDVELHELIQRLLNEQLSTAENNVDEATGNSEEEPPP